MKIKLDGECYGENNEIEINKGITILTGPNGSGKTYACYQIAQYLKEQDIDYLHLDIFKEGKTTKQEYIDNGNMKALARSIVSSEGQNVYDTLIEKHIGDIGYYINNLSQKGIEEAYVIVDGCDSGVSIDLLLSIRYAFDFILEDCTKSGIDLYLIVTSNSYELIPHYDCIWIPTMKHYSYGDEADGYELWAYEYRKVYKERNGTNE